MLHNSLMEVDVYISTGSVTLKQSVEMTCLHSFDLNFDILVIAQNRLKD